MGYIESIRKKIGHDEIIAVGAGVFIYQNEKVLLQRRKDNLCWSMHGAVWKSVKQRKKPLNGNCWKRRGWLRTPLSFWVFFQVRVYDILIQTATGHAS